jgi:hypothetical protein
LGGSTSSEEKLCSSLTPAKQNIFDVHNSIKHAGKNQGTDI